MHREIPSFEWAPGVPIEDEMKDEQELASATDNGVIEETPPTETDEVEMIEGEINNNHVEVQGEALEPAIKEGFIIVPEDGIVSVEEDSNENEEEEEL